MQDEIKTTAEAVEASAMPRSVEVHTDGAAHPQSVCGGFEFVNATSPKNGLSSRNVDGTEL